MPLPLFEFLTGQAGTGKTWTLKKRISDWKEQQQSKGKRFNTRNYATLAATTGIAAINLSGGTGDTVVTINSELGYYDTQSLKDNFASKRLHNRLKDVARKGNNLAIDEISMMDAEQLDLIYDALCEVNELQEVHNRGGLGLILSGDFCQLPPVKADFAFRAKCWNQVQVTKLTKIWRQSDGQYIDMLNAARAGDGEKTAEIAYNSPEIVIRPMVDSEFEGTTIVPVNKLVDSLNKIRLDGLIKQGKKIIELKSYRWGKQLGEWKNIPEVRTICEGAYVMILANDAPAFSYANGSCGEVVGANALNGNVDVKLVDGARIVTVRKVTRKCFSNYTPEGYQDVEKWLSKKEWMELKEKEHGGFGEGITNDGMYKSYLLQLTADSKLKNGANKPYFDFIETKWVIGEITYSPVRLAYASTVHKTQGLSLDKVQIDYSHAFFGEPSMSYVALSRCRTPAGLTIVGNKKLIEDRTNISEEIVPWL